MQPSKITSLRALFIVLISLFASISTLHADSRNKSSKNGIWQEMRKSFSLNHHADSSRVKTQRDRFLRNKHEVTRLILNAEPYMYYIMQEVKRRGLPGEIAVMPMIESAFDPFAYSHAGASGIWQIMPGTGSGFGLTQDYWVDGRRDVEAATNATLDYLTYLHKLFDGDWSLAIAAYNAGEGNVKRAQKRNRNAGKATTFFALPVPKETRAYVPRLYALADIIKNPEKYNITLPNVLNKPYFEIIDVGQQIDLTYGAHLAEMDIKEFHNLNPGHNQWISRPDGPHTILIPISQASKFKRNLRKYRNSSLVKWNEHEVQTGESLKDIAQQYKTTVEIIRKTNDLSSTKVKQGKTLRVPQKRLVEKKPEVKKEWRNSADRIKTNRGPMQIVHTVKNGDTVYTVAKQYNTRAAALAYWNQIKGNQRLEQGQELVIWTRNRELANLVNNGSSIRVVHRVKKGESLDRIARRYKVTIKDIKRWNRSAANSKFIHPGQQLMIYS